MNKLCNFMVLFMALSGNVYAQKTEPWNDPLVNNINRNEPVSDFFGYENKELSDRNDKTLSKRFLSIEGNWKFNWVQNANERPLDFYSLNLKNNRSCTIITASNHGPTFIIYKCHPNVLIFDYSD